MYTDRREKWRPGSLMRMGFIWNIKASSKMKELYFGSTENDKAFSVQIRSDMRHIIASTCVVVRSCGDGWL